MGKDGEHRTECRKVPCRHWLNELFRQEVDVVLERRGFLPIPQQIKLRQKLFRDGTAGLKTARSRCDQQGMLSKPSKPGTSISVSKSPVSPTNALFFNPVAREYVWQTLDLGHDCGYLYYKREHGGEQYNLGASWMLNTGSAGKQTRPSQLSKQHSGNR